MTSGSHGTQPGRHAGHEAHLSQQGRLSQKPRLLGAIVHISDLACGIVNLVFTGEL